MKTQTIKIALTINGKKLTLGHSFLENIEYMYGIDTKENQEAFDMLVYSDNPKIRRSIALLSNISKKSISILLNDDDQNVVQAVLGNYDLAPRIKHVQLMKIIKDNHIEHLKTIASNHIVLYKKCNLYKIIKLLAKHENPAVRFELVRYHSTHIIPKKILKKLSKDIDIDVSKAAIIKLKRVA